MTLANPAAYLFFSAIFPAFLARPAGAVLLLGGLVAPTLAITFGCMMLYAGCGQALTRFLDAPRRMQAFQRILGGTFILLGAWAALGR